MCQSSRRITLSDRFWHQQQAIKRALSQKDRQRHAKSVCVCGRSWPFSEGAGCSNSSCVSAFFNRVKHIIAVCGVRLRTRPEFNHHLFLKDTSHIHTEDNGQCIYQGSLPKPPGLPLSSSSFFPALYFLINAFSLSEKQKTKKENTGSMAPESRLMPTVIKPEKPCRGISGP